MSRFSVHDSRNRFKPKASIFMTGFDESRLKQGVSTKSDGTAEIVHE